MGVRDEHEKLGQLAMHMLASHTHTVAVAAVAIMSLLRFVRHERRRRRR